MVRWSTRKALFLYDQRLVPLREKTEIINHLNINSLNTTLYCPYLSIRIKNGNGGYSIAKVKSSQTPTGLITRIKTEIVVAKDSLIVVSISGPTESEYDTDDKLVPHCEDIYLLTTKDGQKISFGIRDIYRVDMPDISLVRPIEEIFLEQLDSYCH